MKQCLVFVGPTLAWDEVRAFPHAVPMPPAAQGDILRAVHEHHPDAILLVDGAMFGQGAVAWHKEVLYALSQGIRVYGAGALGAQYAADLCEFGMFGLGRVYNLYRDGATEDVSEVAVRFSRNGDVFHRHTISMINLRATCQYAAEQRLLDEQALAIIQRTAGNIFFADRSLDAILAAAAAECVSEKDLTAFAECCRDRLQDVQAQDARDALHLMMDDAAASHDARNAYDFSRSVVSQMVLERERLLHAGTGSCRVADMVSRAALQEPCFNETCERALNRGLALILAQEMGVVAEEREVGEEILRFWRRLGLHDDASRDAWMTRNHCVGPVFDALMCEEATLRRMRRWMLNLFAHAGGPASIAKQLWLENRFEALAEKTGQENVLVDEASDASWAHLLDIAGQGNLIQRHFSNHPQVCPDADYATWITDMGISQEEAYMALVRAAAARQRMEDVLMMAASTEDA